MPSSLSTSTSVLSPAPVSPFSPRTLSSSASHYTSDDLPDLGAFTTVLREWVHLQPYPRIPQYHKHPLSPLPPPSTTGTTAVHSTVWNQRPIANYLGSALSHLTRTTSLGSDSEQSSDLYEERGDDDEDDTEGGRTVEIDDDEDNGGTHLASVGSTPLRTQPSLDSLTAGDDHEHEHEVPIIITVDPDTDNESDTDPDTGAFPSLGYLDEALNFIATERAKWSALRGSAGPSLREEEGEWMHVIEPLPHRKSKRKHAGRPVQVDSERLSIAKPDKDWRLDYLNYPRSEDEDEEHSSLRTSKQSRSRSIPPTSRPTPSTSTHAYDSTTTTTTTTTTAVDSTSPPTSTFTSKSKTRPKLKTQKPKLKMKSLKPGPGDDNLVTKTKPKAGGSRGIINIPYKILIHSRSTPTLGLIANPASPSGSQAQAQVSGAGTHMVPRRGIRDMAPTSERTRLLELVSVLKGVFPEDGKGLREVEGRLKRKKEGNVGMGDGDEGGEVLDVRGRDPELRAGDPLVHVFVDHSNILVGLLMYLKRYPKGKAREKGKTVLKPKPPKPRPPSMSANGDLVQGEDADDGSGQDAVLFSPPGKEADIETTPPTSAERGYTAGVVPIHGSGTLGKDTYTTKGGVPTTFTSTAGLQTQARIGTETGKTPIPLPSFATAGRGGQGSTIVSPTQYQSRDRVSRVVNGEVEHTRSTSTSKVKSKTKGSYLSRSKSTLGFGALATAFSMSTSVSGFANTNTNGNTNIFLSTGDLGVQDGEDGGEEDEGDEEEESEQKMKKRQARRLSHAALALILERGRPITRRVLVTSSPLYQPMDTMERLGYEVRVYMRVPDLGDGMDRDRQHHHKHGSGSGSSLGKHKTHARRISGSTSTESASASTSAGEAVKGVARNHAVPPPISFTFPEGSSSLNTRAATGSSHTHTLDHNPTSPSAQYGFVGTGKRVRYREQGVDELLQLKLHQALAATDDVPEGATIVLATGDGNVGQFNEDGFLGPIRTALRRGWKVELYAWEEGLSRAWRREFGEESEWGKNGMFRIVGMEQFAESLVEGGL